MPRGGDKLNETYIKIYLHGREMLNRNLKIKLIKNNHRRKYKLGFIKWNNMMTHGGINFNRSLTKDMKYCKKHTIMGNRIKTSQLHP